LSMRRSFMPPVRRRTASRNAIPRCIRPARASSGTSGWRRIRHRSSGG